MEKKKLTSLRYLLKGLGPLAILDRKEIREIKDLLETQDQEV